MTISVFNANQNTSNMRQTVHQFLYLLMLNTYFFLCFRLFIFCQLISFYLSTNFNLSFSVFSLLIIKMSFSEGCYQSEQIVVKAVRLHSNNLLPWIVDTDIKVVQLVRDPRAILNSQFKQSFFCIFLHLPNKK